VDHFYTATNRRSRGALWPIFAPAVITLSVRVDNGKSVKLDAGHARHIEYGYAVETAQGASADRIIVTGEAVQLALQHEAFTRLSTHIRDISLYTSDSREIDVGIAIPHAGIALAQDGSSPTIDNMPGSSLPEITLEGFGIGL